MSDSAASATERFICAKRIAICISLSKTIDASQFGVGQNCCWALSLLPNDDGKSVDGVHSPARLKGKCSDWFPEEKNYS